MSSWRRDGALGWGACPAIGSVDGEPQRAQEPMSGHLCSGASGLAQVGTAGENRSAGVSGTVLREGWVKPGCVNTG